MPTPAKAERLFPDDPLPDDPLRDDPLPDDWRPRSWPTSDRWPAPDCRPRGGDIPCPTVRLPNSWARAPSAKTSHPATAIAITIHFALIGDPPVFRVHLTFLPVQTFSVARIEPANYPQSAHLVAVRYRPTSTGGRIERSGSHSPVDPGR